MTATQTISDLRAKTLQPAEAQLPMVQMGFGSSQGFELMQRGAKLLAASTLVPKEFQGNLPNCTIALNMANRLGADPLLVMQNLYVVHGRPGWSSKFLIATFNQCGRFTSVRYEWKGVEGTKDWGCRAWATEKLTGERIEGVWITWKMVEAEGWNKRNGSKWNTIPDQMFTYRAAAWMINTHAPELSMGLSTAEELGDLFEAQRDESGTYSVTAESLRQVEREVGGAVDGATGEVLTGTQGDGRQLESAAATPERQPVKKQLAAPQQENANAAMPTDVGQIQSTESSGQPHSTAGAAHLVEGEVSISYKFVADSLNGATTLDQLDEAADLIRGVPNEVHRGQLNALYEERAAALQS